MTFADYCDDFDYDAPFGFIFHDFWTQIAVAALCMMLGKAAVYANDNIRNFMEARYEP